MGWFLTHFLGTRKLDFQASDPSLEQEAAWKVSQAKETTNFWFKVIIPTKYSYYLYNVLISIMYVQRMLGIQVQNLKIDLTLLALSFGFLKNNDHWEYNALLKLLFHWVV